MCVERVRCRHAPSASIANTLENKGRLSLARWSMACTIFPMGGRVLVVDDDNDIRESLTEILMSEGFDVAQAANGLDALAEIDRERPDVVLLDLMMPVLD